MGILEIQKEVWSYPPTLSKSTGKSRRPYDNKELIHIESDLFDFPTIIMSDLHQHAYNIAVRLSQHLDLSKYIVITAGDMAGNGYFGSNGDPTSTYEFFSNLAKSFYFVQGNHDLPGDQDRHLDLTNDDGSRCMLSDGKIIDTALGKIVGINGIIGRSKKARLYRHQPEDFNELVEKTLRKKPKLFITHETPAIPITIYDKSYTGDNDQSPRSYIGKNDLFEIVNRLKPKVHIYGHCYHNQYSNYVNGVQYLNADARILIVYPISET